jgi:hypothetical protein
MSIMDALLIEKHIRGSTPRGTKKKKRESPHPQLASNDLKSNMRAG